VWLAQGLDDVYSRLMHSLSSEAFFCRGWGDVSTLDPQNFTHTLRHLQHAPLQVAWRAVRRAVHGTVPYEVRVQGSRVGKVRVARLGSEG